MDDPAEVGEVDPEVALAAAAIVPSAAEVAAVPDAAVARVAAVRFPDLGLRRVLALPR